MIIKYRIFKVLQIAVIGCALSASAAAAQSLNFDIRYTQICLQNAGDDWDAMDWCIGEAANACMENTPGGSSTVGMSGCIDRELTWWDGRLNQTYQRLRQRERSRDAEYGSHTEITLRDMQRAWIPFRDATCDYERAQWGGGTGGGPATVGCLMRLTAQQTLYLERMMADY